MLYDSCKHIENKNQFYDLFGLIYKKRKVFSNYLCILVVFLFFFLIKK